VSLHFIWSLASCSQVELLLDSGADLRTSAASDGDQPLHRAVKFQHIHVVKLVMERCDPKARRKLLCAENVLGFTPLHLAAKYGLDEIAELLMEYGGDPDASDERGCTAKDLASLNGHGLTRAVLDDPDTARAQAEAQRAEALCRENDLNLLEACKVGDQAWAADLLAKGANLHHADELGDTPLHQTAKRAHGKLSKFLVSMGADPIAVNHVRARPLRGVCRYNSATSPPFISASLHLSLSLSLSCRPASCPSTMIRPSSGSRPALCSSCFYLALV